MPWEKGHIPFKEGGRKGFELEEAEKEKMNGIVKISLIKLKKIQEGKATKKEIADWQAVSGTVNKILDKFAANKTDVKVSGDEDSPLRLNVDINKILDKSYGDSSQCSSDGKVH